MPEGAIGPATPVSGVSGPALGGSAPARAAEIIPLPGQTAGASGPVPAERPRETADRLELSRGSDNDSSSSGSHDAYAKFTVHEKTGQVTIKIVDSRTNEVIREIPPEQIVRLAEEIQKYLDAGQRRLDRSAGGARGR